MNLQERPAVPRPHAQPRQEILIDLTSDSDSDRPLASRNQRRNISSSEPEFVDFDSDDEPFVAVQPRAPPPRQPRVPQQQILIIDSPSPEPQVIQHRPARPSVRRPARDPSSSPEFQAAPPVRPRENMHVNVLPEQERFPPYESDSDTDIDIGIDSDSPDPYPQQLANFGDVDLAPRGVMGDYMLDEDFEEAFVRRGINLPGDVVNLEAYAGRHENPVNEQARPHPAADMVVQSKEECFEILGGIFPGICEEYVAEIWDKESKSSDVLIAHILGKSEKGIAYPTARDKQNLLKRKRELDEDEEAARKYGALDRVIPAVGAFQHLQIYIRKILSQEFGDIPLNFIDAALSQSGHRLFSTYRVLEEAQRTFEPAAPTYQKLKRPRSADEYKDGKLDREMAEVDQARKEILEELIACRRIRRKADQKRQEIRQAELDEEENTRNAEAEGTMSECGCCMGDYPLNRMVHCDSEDMHWFCRACALKTAETEIENTRYEIKCMSMDGCEGGFSLEQRSQFLDAKTMVALERNEQESNLRLAGIENLASCPFCPYAAEYPPIEVNHQFQCQRPDCEKLSCRHCKLESHIPRSCEEFAKENGLSIRRQIEEAMSAALIRKCNKCQTPFIKEEGCNKMTCTRPGCHNIQCYVCSRSCGYDHFNDVSRGGKPENCPLFENAEVRHDQEVKNAEKAAMDKVRADHPEYTEEDLRVKMSDNVQRDDARRKGLDAQARGAGVIVNGVRHAMPPAQGGFLDGFQRHIVRAPAAALQRRAQVVPPPGLGNPGPQVNAQQIAVMMDDDPGLLNPWDDGDDVMEFLRNNRRRGPLPLHQNVPGQPPNAAPNNQPGNAPAAPAAPNHPGRLFGYQFPRAQVVPVVQTQVQPQVHLEPNGVRARVRAALNPAAQQPLNYAMVGWGNPFQHPQAQEQPRRVEDRPRFFDHDLPNLVDINPHINAMEQHDRAINQHNLAIEQMNIAERANAQNAAMLRQLGVMRGEAYAQAAANGRHVPIAYPPANPPADPNVARRQQDRFQREQMLMRAAREQSILDHAERRIHRRQEVARIRREAQDDEAALAARLAADRRNVVAAAERNIWAVAQREGPVKREEDDEFDMDEDEDDDEDEDEDDDEY